MPVSNPYLSNKKKKSSTTSTGSTQPPAPPSSVKPLSSTTLSEKTNAIPASTTHSTEAKPDAKTSRASSRPSKKKPTFKSQLKREIEELKRVKAAKQQQKILEERLKEKQTLEKQRQALEKQRQEAKKRKQEERARIEAEKQQLREIKALKRQEAAREKERERLEKAREQHERYQQLMMDLERRKEGCYFNHQAQAPRVLATYSMPYAPTLIPPVASVRAGMLPSGNSFGCSPNAKHSMANVGPGKQEPAVSVHQDQSFPNTTMAHHFSGRPYHDVFPSLAVSGPKVPQMTLTPGQSENCTPLTKPELSTSCTTVTPLPAGVQQPRVPHVTVKGNIKFESPVVDTTKLESTGQDGNDLKKESAGKEEETRTCAVATVPTVPTSGSNSVESKATRKQSEMIMPCTPAHVPLSSHDANIEVDRVPSANGGSLVKSSNAVKQEGRPIMEQSPAHSHPVRSGSSPSGNRRESPAQHLSLAPYTGPGPGRPVYANTLQQPGGFGSHVPTLEATGPFPYHPAPPQFHASRPPWASHVPFQFQNHFSFYSPSMPPPMSYPNHLPNVPRKKRTPATKPMVLHKEPMVLPSPYAASYEILEEEIVICKERGKSFGVVVKFESQSALVDPPPMVEEKSGTLNGIVETSMSNVSSPPVLSKSFGGAAASITEALPGSLQKATLLSSQSDGRQIESSGGDVQKGVDNEVPKGSYSQQSHATITSKVLNSDPTVASTAVLHKKQRRRRRRRVFFGTMAVTDVAKQYASNSSVHEEKRLRPGDVILKINGKNTSGLPFPAACALFAAEPQAETRANEKEPSLIQCSLVVARPKPKPKQAQFKEKDRFQKLGTVDNARILTTPPLPTIPIVVDEATKQIVAGEFSDLEMASLLRGMVKGLEHPARALGYKTPKDILAQYMRDPTLSRRDLSTILKKWKHVTSTLNNRMDNLALEYWREQWKLETKSVGLQGGFEYLTDAQRSSMRALPRPARGCKCGAPDHEYVHDPKCVLYRNLRRLQPTSGSPVSPLARKKDVKIKNLNAVETAFKDRIVKLRSEQELQSEEARFVQEMEEIQLKQCKMAVFSPSLATMVLSAVADLDDAEGSDEVLAEVAPKNVSEKCSDEKVASQVIEDQPNRDHEDSSDDEDDDLPLVALGKRNNAGLSPPESKRAKLGNSSFDGFSLCFLAKLMNYISSTWGHVYRESSHLDYAWRWEVCRGQLGHGVANTEDRKTNPRLPGSFSFETFRFALKEKDFSKSIKIGHISAEPRPTPVNISNDPMPPVSPVNTDRFSKLEKSPANGENVKHTRAEMEDMILITHLVSPERSGLYDELATLVRSGVLRVNTQGSAVLADEWHAKVDVLLLNDMLNQWAPQNDVDNKYSINDKVRTTLAEHWKRVEGGWVFVDDLEDVIYDDDEYNEWRESFQNVHQAQADDAEGIGNFGF